MTNRSEDETAELSSPACSMPEADDTYMGYAGKTELAAFLNELLEAELAGALQRLERRLKSIGQEAERIQEVALAGSVAADEDGKGAEVDLAPADALVVPDLHAAEERA